jgi:hypothetical protein
MHDLHRTNGTSLGTGSSNAPCASHPAGTIRYFKPDWADAGCSVVRNPHWIRKGDTQTANGPSQNRKTGSLPAARRLSFPGRSLDPPILTIIAVTGALSTFCLGLRNPGPNRSQAGKSDPKRLAGRMGEGEGQEGWVGDSGIGLFGVPLQGAGSNLNNRQALGTDALAWLSPRSLGSLGRGRGGRIVRRASLPAECSPSLWQLCALRGPLPLAADCRSWHPGEDTCPSRPSSEDADPFPVPFSARGAARHPRMVATIHVSSRAPDLGVHGLRLGAWHGLPRPWQKARKPLPGPRVFIP